MCATNYKKCQDDGLDRAGGACSAVLTLVEHDSEPFNMKHHVAILARAGGNCVIRGKHDIPVQVFLDVIISTFPVVLCDGYRSVKTSMSR